MLLLLLLHLNLSVNAAEIDWSEYDFEQVQQEMDALEEGQYYYKDVVVYDSFSELVKALAEGRTELSFTQILYQMGHLLLGELRSQWTLIVELAVLLIISGLMRNLDLSFGNSQVGEITFYVLFGAAVTLLFESFTTAYQIAVETGDKTSGLLLGLLPVLAGIKAAAGGQISAAVQSGLWISGINLLSWLTQNIFLTGILLFVVLATVNQLTGHNMMKKISKLAKILIQKGIRITSGIFLFFMGLQGLSAGAADTWLKKTVISAAGAVPVVGDAIGGAVDSILAGASMVGKCAGSAGMILLLGVCMIPVAKLAAMWLMYKITSALLSPVADPKLNELIEASADGVGMLIGVLVVITGMFVCGIGIFLRGL